MGSVEEFPLHIWHKALEMFFSKLNSFTALLQKGWGFPKSCGGMGIGSEFHGMLPARAFVVSYLEPWCACALGHCMSILERQIYF